MPEKYPMSKPSYEDLEQRVQELENQVRDLKRVKQSLGGTEWDISRLLNELRDGFFLTDTKGTIIYINKTLGDIFGYENPEEVIGEHFHIFLPPDVRDEMTEKFNRSISDRDNTETIEFPALRKDGSTLFLQMKTSPVLEGDRIVYIKGIIRDITTYKAAEDALGKSERRLRALLNAITETAILIDLEGTIQALNKTAAQRFGGTVEQLTCKCLWDVIPPHMVQLRKEKRKSVIESGVPLRFEDERDGEFYDTNLYPIFDRDGKVVSLAIFARQITEQKWALQALHESHERYKSLFEDNQTVILLVHPDTWDIVDANQAACSFYGYSKEELTSKKITEINILPKEEIKWILKGIRTTPQRRFSFPHRLANGEIRQVESFTGPISMNGKLMLYTMVHDVTERVRTQNALAESEAKYRLLIESMNDGLVISDENDLITYCNEKFPDMVGYEKSEVIGSHSDRYLDEPQQRTARKQIAGRRTGEKSLYELQWNHKDGRKVPTFVSGTPIMDVKGNYKGSFAVITDVTDLKRTEQALIEREKELKIRTKNLEDVNTALRVLLQKRDRDKAELEDRILFNVKELIMPHLEKLKAGGLKTSQNAHLGIIELNLSQIIAPFSHNLSLKHMNLSHTEIEVANLIKEGKKTKAIAETFQISSKTIEDHRKNIRKKLGITNMKTNLRTHLLSM
jgi:PAS domain S-box-containing protein